MAAMFVWWVSFVIYGGNSVQVFLFEFCVFYFYCSWTTVLKRTLEMSYHTNKLTTML